jgi:hypothetical protein
VVNLTLRRQCDDRWGKYRADRLDNARDSEKSATGDDALVELITDDVSPMNGHDIVPQHMLEMLTSFALVPEAMQRNGHHAVTDESVDRVRQTAVNVKLLPSARQSRWITHFIYRC